MSSSPAKKLGLIGFGAFGRLVAEHLRNDFDVIVADAVDYAAEAAELGVRWTTLEEAAACPYVLLAVPIQRFRGVLEAIRGHVQPGSLVIDVGSVKVAPIAAMEELLPAEVEIIGTHPMFGPQSAADGLPGHRIVVCPVRTERLDEVRSFLADRLGLEVHICDAETHDRQIARTQALAQFIGRALAELEESRSPVRTPGYDQLRHVAETVGADSWELFAAIQNLNPYSAEVRKELLYHLEELQQRLTEYGQPSSQASANDAAEGSGAAGASDSAEEGDAAEASDAADTGPTTESTGETLETSGTAAAGETMTASGAASRAPGPDEA